MVFNVTLTDNYGKAIEAIEFAVGRLQNMDPIFGEKGGEMCAAWAESRLSMYKSAGATTGSPWPRHTTQERRYYLPVKRAALRRRALPSNNLLRFSPSPSWSARPGERLFPGLTDPAHKDFVYRRPDPQTLVVGTLTPWAADIDAGRGEWRPGTYRGRTKDGKSKRVRERISTVSRVVRAPARHLIRFGAPFTEWFRNHCVRVAIQLGGAKVGLSTQEVMERIMRSRLGGRRG